MRPGVLGYYNRVAWFTLSQVADVKSPNVLEFVAGGMYAATYTQPGDVIRIYQPVTSASVYNTYHEPDPSGPLNYYINGLSPATASVFPTNSISVEDSSVPLFIVELGK